ncbi:hypothetical protein BPAE_0370g00010 [Botrytis paeoniae]|uniref:Uncharacterized protein n=1 Tax=Botrytis paeoniae TaxID=278948 RepID=A0A4Z1F2J4_9HELO|nr:hypothetical protein BPAE_0370g00010 [Botrytis paeoniae]
MDVICLDDYLLSFLGDNRWSGIAVQCVAYVARQGTEEKIMKVYRNLEEGLNIGIGRWLIVCAERFYADPKGVVLIIMIWGFPVSGLKDGVGFSGVGLDLYARYIHIQKGKEKGKEKGKGKVRNDEKSEK